MPAPTSKRYKLSNGTALIADRESILEYERLLKVAYGYLVKSIHKDLYHVVNHTRDPLVARTALRDHLRTKSAPGCAITASILKDKLMNELHMKPLSQGGRSLWLFRRIEDLRDQLSAHSEPVSDSELITAMIRGLPTEFNSVTYDFGFRASKGDKSITYGYAKDTVEHFEILLHSLQRC